jgi:hypothetical protein
MSALRRERLTGAATRTNPSRPGIGASHSENRSFVKFRSREMPFGTTPKMKKTLVNTIIESNLQGVSTQRVRNIVQHLGIRQFSLV